jgi:hypothetical protein
MRAKSSDAEPLVPVLMREQAASDKPVASAIFSNR